MSKDQAEQMVNEIQGEEVQKDTSADTPSEQESAIEALAAAAAAAAEGGTENADDADATETTETREEQLTKELADMKDQWLRSVAELDNVRKRAERDKSETRKYAVTEFARDLTNVCENLHRALDSVTADMLESENNALLKTLHSGVDMTRNELLKSFERHGMTRIHPNRGDAFDPNQHQAVSQIEDGGVADGTIAQIIQSGYSIHGRLLQPAMVAVAKSVSDTPRSVDTSA